MWFWYAAYADAGKEIEREREGRRETRTFLRAKESFQSETTTWLKPKVLHTHKHIHTHGVLSAPSELPKYVCLNNLNLYLQSTRLKLAPHTSRTADSFSLSKHNFWLTHTYTHMHNTHTCLHIRLFPISLWLQLLVCFFPFFWAAAKYFICNALARCPCPEEGKYGRRGRAACLAILLPLQMMGSSWTTLEAVAVAKAWPTFYVGHARVLLQRLLTMLIGRRRFCPNVHFTNSFEYPASGPSHVCMCVCVFSILNMTL